VSRFRKKPVETEAMQWDGDNTSDVVGWVLDSGGTARWRERTSNDEAAADGVLACEHIAVDTLEGRTFAVVGDWIIRGVKGEFYPCKPDIFEATYDAVDPASPEEVTGVTVTLRALNDSDSGTCDWGGCDDEAVLARHDPAVGWLPVCGHHAYARHLIALPGLTPPDATSPAPDGVSPTPARDFGSGAVDEMDPSPLVSGLERGGQSVDVPRETGRHLT
jgi:hypothetical protein